MELRQEVDQVGISGELQIDMNQGDGNDEEDRTVVQRYIILA
jgi:hypothetical protein